MPDNRHSDREKIEVLLTRLILANRLKIMASGIVLFLLAMAVLPKFILAGGILAIFAGCMIASSLSLDFAILTAKFLAWFATIGKKE